MAKMGRPPKQPMDRARVLPFGDMAIGPDPEKAKECAERAEYYGMMAKFYTLEKKEQRAFLAFFEEIGRG